MIEYFIKFVNRLSDFWIYLHFAIYWYNYIIFINIIFNHLISTSKLDFFLTNSFFWFWNTLFQVLFTEKKFNFNLVEVQKHVVSKVVFVTIIFYHYNVFSPWSKYYYSWKKNLIPSLFQKEFGSLTSTPNSPWNLEYAKKIARGKY